MYLQWADAILLMEKEENRTSDNLRIEGQNTERFAWTVDFVMCINGYCF
jgi:hypothetical protein